MDETHTANPPSRAAHPPPPAQNPDPWVEMLRVRATLSVEVPVVQLTVRELYCLVAGSVVATGSASGENVPLRAGGRLIAWGEFQVIGDQLALRIAELA